MIASATENRRTATRLNIPTVSGHVSGDEGTRSCFQRALTARNIRNGTIVALGSGIALAELWATLQLTYDYGNAVGYMDENNPSLAVFAGGILGAGGGVVASSLIVGSLMLGGQTCRRLTCAGIHGVSTVAGLIAGIASGSVAGYVGWRDSTDAIHAARKIIQAPIVSGRASRLERT